MFYVLYMCVNENKPTKRKSSNIQSSVLAAVRLKICTFRRNNFNANFTIWFVWDQNSFANC